MFHDYSKSIKAVRRQRNLGLKANVIYHLKERQESASNAIKTI
jgi:hypothetical protein